jgi:hypothetical protein
MLIVANNITNSQQTTSRLYLHSQFHPTKIRINTAADGGMVERCHRRREELSEISSLDLCADVRAHLTLQ